MRGKNLNTMYRRRTVRPDSRVYRQTRKLAGAAAARQRGMGRIVLVLAVLVVIALGLWMLKR